MLDTVGDISFSILVWQVEEMDCASGLNDVWIDSDVSIELNFRFMGVTHRLQCCRSGEDREIVCKGERVWRSSQRRWCTASAEKHWMEVENAEESTSKTVERGGYTVIGRTCCKDVSDYGSRLDCRRSTH